MRVDMAEDYAIKAQYNYEAVSPSLALVLFA